ncbi:MAG: CPXCG motif-containing cysteine-rich protein [Planctomycetota bacterium]
MGLKILFLHGWQSVPGGVKPKHLAARGHQVWNPALDDEQFELALAVAQANLDRHRPDVIVGSSRGGAVAMNLESGGTPLVLLCPAWKRWGAAKRVKPNAVILHSRADEVIPFSDSLELLAASGLPEDALLEVGSDHRLADESSLSVMHWAAELLGAGQWPPWLDEPPVREAFPAISAAWEETAIEGAYVCDACGEEIVIPLDPSEGSIQEYIEDCPVCCRANLISIQFEEGGQVIVSAQPEQENGL